jgi:hypothetical protein
MNSAVGLFGLDSFMDDRPLAARPLPLSSGEQSSQNALWTGEILTNLEMEHVVRAKSRYMV